MVFSLCSPLPKPYFEIRKSNAEKPYLIPFSVNNRQSLILETTTDDITKVVERGIEFQTGKSFFRHESAIGRDLGVLSAHIYKSTNGTLRVLDALCGCGVRSLRYLVQSGADYVWANDANETYRKTIVSNLSQEANTLESRRRWVVTHSDANRVLAECYLNKDFFDFIDIDSFGSDSGFLRSSFSALKLGGLLYITCTDGFSSGGHRPQHSLASYGAYVRPMPYSNEVGLRMLIGGAVREAAVLGFYVTPLFSYYSYHGPVFRVMLQVNRGKRPEKNGHYGFITYCTRCGDSQAYKWNELGKMSCPCSNGEISTSLVVSGPLWTGPLHDAVYVNDMLTLAEKWGWTSSGKNGEDLKKLLKLMIEESNPNLSFGYVKLDEISSRAKVNSPSLKTIISRLTEEGYVASRSHISSNSIKTNCPMSICIRVAKEIQNARTV